MRKKNVDLLDSKAISEFAKFIDTLANEALDEYWHRSQLEELERRSDATAVARLVSHIFKDGGGTELRSKFYGHLEKLILKRLIDIQGGAYHVTEDYEVEFRLNRKED